MCSNTIAVAYCFSCSYNFGTWVWFCSTSLRTRWFLLHIHSLILVLASQHKGRFLRQPCWRPRVVELLTCGYCGIVFIRIRWRPSSRLRNVRLRTQVGLFWLCVCKIWIRLWKCRNHTGNCARSIWLSRGAPIFADWMIIMRNVSPACMGVLRDVLSCPGVTSVLTGHRVCGMLRRGIGRQPWNDVFGRRTRKPLPPLPASPRGPVTSRVVRFSHPVTHLRLTAVRVGTLGRGRPRRSIPEMRHGLSVDAPRHGAVMALTRIGLSVFALHPRPLVMRYGWSGLAPRHQCAMKGWSLLALLQFHMVRRGPQGLTLSLTTMREAYLTMTSLVMMNSPRGFRDPVLNRVVMMTSCWLRHLALALLSHHSRWIVLRIIPVELVSFAIGKRRVPQGPPP